MFRFSLVFAVLFAFLAIFTVTSNGAPLESSSLEANDSSIGNITISSYGSITELATTSSNHSPIPESASTYCNMRFYRCFRADCNYCGQGPNLNINFFPSVPGKCYDLGDTFSEVNFLSACRTQQGDENAMVVYSNGNCSGDRRVIPFGVGATCAHSIPFRSVIFIIRQ